MYLEHRRTDQTKVVYRQNPKSKAPCVLGYVWAIPGDIAHTYLDAALPGRVWAT